MPCRSVRHAGRFDVSQSRSSRWFFDAQMALRARRATEKKNNCFMAILRPCETLWHIHIWPAKFLYEAHI